MQSFETYMLMVLCVSDWYTLFLVQLSINNGTLANRNPDIKVK